MAKEILKKELIYIDFKKNESQFYNVEVLSVGYNQMQVIVTYGKLFTKGKESITRLEDFNDALKLAYKKIYDKKSEGFVSREKMQIAVDEVYKKEQKDYEFKQKKGKKADHACGKCKKVIPEKVYKRIDDWARGEGNWDLNPDFAGYKKVLCIDCQVDLDVFKKKMP